MARDAVGSAPPMMTQALPGVGGVFKSEDSDFYVEEIPLVTLGKKGSHVHFLIEKKGITTAEAVEAIAHAIGKRNRDIGYAGLKDARAVTRQWISIERIPPDRVRRLKLRNIRILDWGRHADPLRVGCLKGNRFRIRIRDLRCPVAQAVKQAQAILSVLCDRGMPNAFGVQRFGNRGNSHLLGKAILLDQREQFLDLFLGDPRRDDNPNDARVRSLYSRGLFNKALKTCPGYMKDTRRVLSVLVKNRGDKRKAFDFVAESRIRFLVSAYQSSLFNQVLSARMPLIDQLMAGDIACQHSSGDCFSVTDPAQDQGRCRQFEISPTGPIYSPTMTKPSGQAGKMENKIFHEAQVSRITKATEMRKYLSQAGRRSLRVQPARASVASGRSKHGDYLELKFDLPSGSYATVLLREVVK